MGNNLFLFKSKLSALSDNKGSESPFCEFYHKKALFLKAWGQTLWIYEIPINSESVPSPPPE